MMPIKVLALFTTLLFSVSALAMPKITVNHKRSTEGLAEVQVVNDTIEHLICHVAIDGHKILFRLKARGYSTWYTATDTRFNHTNFSIWCDYLKLHPKYQKK